MHKHFWLSVRPPPPLSAHPHTYSAWKVRRNMSMVVGSQCCENECTGSRDNLYKRKAVVYGSYMLMVIAMSSTLSCNLQVWVRNPCSSWCMQYLWAGPMIEWDKRHVKIPCKQLPPRCEYPVQGLQYISWAELEELYSPQGTAKFTATPPNGSVNTCLCIAYSSEFIRRNHNTGQHKTYILESDEFKNCRL